MAQLIEAQGNATLAKCKGAAVIITAVTGLVLGVLNHFREVRDPRVKDSYTELSKQVQLVSKDVQKLDEAMRHQQEQIDALMGYALQSKADEVKVAAAKTRLKAVVVHRPQAPAKPPLRSPESWNKVSKGRAD
jgi:hypothetical protein